MPKITILPDNKTFELVEDKSILQTALENDIPHVNACGGEGNVQHAGCLF